MRGRAAPPHQRIYRVPSFPPGGGGEGKTILENEEGENHYLLNLVISF